MLASLTLLALTMQGVVPATAASSHARSAGPPVAAIVVETPTTPTTPAPAIDARLVRADSLAFAGRMSAAERLYRRVIDEQSNSGTYAKDALWHLTMAYYLVDDSAQTVRTLDELVSAADRFGDPQTELEASFEAARLHTALYHGSLIRNNHGYLARGNAERVRNLMQSPAIPDSVKAIYSTRMEPTI